MDKERKRELDALERERARLKIHLGVLRFETALAESELAIIEQRIRQMRGGTC